MNQWMKLEKGHPFRVLLQWRQIIHVLDDALFD
jgi:hypothetical protein